MGTTLKLLGNSTDSIDRLPAEVLLLVFEYLFLRLLDPASSRGLDVVEITRGVLTSVCSWWRELVVNDPILWSTILYIEQEKICTARNWTRLCLARSTDRDLKIILVLDWGAGYILTKRHSTFRSFIATLDDELPRVKKIVYSNVYGGDSARVFDILPKNIHDLTAQLDYQWELFGMPFAKLRRLDLVICSLSREHLSAIFSLCPLMEHFTLETRTRPRHCITGQSMVPSVNAPSLISLGLHQTAIPARAFIAPHLVELFSFPHVGVGETRWWETNHFPITTPSHREDISDHHFPKLANLAVSVMHNDPEYVDISVRLVKAHPNIRQMVLAGKKAVYELLRDVYTTHSQSRVSIPPDLERIFIYGRGSRKIGQNLANLLRLILSDPEVKKSPLKVIWSKKSLSGGMQRGSDYEYYGVEYLEGPLDLIELEKEFSPQFRICEPDEARGYIVQG